MLARVADSLYWMARYLERAEHTARLLNVNLYGMLDGRAEVSTQRRARVLHSLRVEVSEELADRDVVAALTYDSDVSSSIVRCVGLARQNAREVREEISTEMWEQINRLNLFVRGSDRDAVAQGTAHGFFQDVKEGSHLFQGITDATLSHAEGWHFVQLGRYVERLQSTVSLLGAHLDATPDPGEDAESDAYTEWVDLLKSCTAYEAYCRAYSVHVDPDRVVEFLVLNPFFPHAVRFGARAIAFSLEALGDAIPQLKHSEAPRTVGKLTSALRFDAVEDVLAGGAQRYLDDVRRRCQQVHQAIYDACIAYPIESALTVRDAQTSLQAAQQQQ